MNNELFQVSGLTPESDYPKCPPKHPCKEICETDKLFIPYQKPEMKDIIEVFISVSVTSFKVICTSQGKKLVIEGIKHVKIMYTADKACQNVHTAHFDIPICAFILLGNTCYKVVCVKTAVEYISVHQMSCRNFTVSTIILFCPILKKEHSYTDPCQDNKHCHNNDEDDCSDNHYDCHEYHHNRHNCNDNEDDYDYEDEENCDEQHYNDCQSEEEYDDKNLYSKKIRTNSNQKNCSSENDCEDDHKFGGTSTSYYYCD